MSDTASRGGAAGAGQGTAARGWLREWAAAWDAFWFTPGDPLPLAVIRIATGLVLTWSAFVWFLDADACFGTAGWLAPHDVRRMNDPRALPWLWSWYFPASPAAARALAAACVVAAVMLTVGLATPLAALFSLAGVVSAVNRAPLNTFGLDDILGLLLVGLAVGPSGARLSLDRLLGWAGQGGPSVRATIAVRLIQVHLCVVYAFSGGGKLLGASWWEGTALWGAAANAQYRTLDLTFLARHPLAVNAATLATLLWEVGYAPLVWPRLTRRLFLAMAVAVHLGIGLTMGMMEFGLAMITANLAFVPAETWRAVGRPFVGRRRTANPSTNGRNGRP